MFSIAVGVPVEAAEMETWRRLMESEQASIHAIYNARWPDGFRCALCSHHQAYVISTRRIPLYECQRCRTQTSLTSGTIMEGSRTPLRHWVKAIYLHSQPNGISAMKLSQMISVTYKTAWLICHKIRHAMTHAESRQLLGGKVHVTDFIHTERNTTSDEFERQEQPIFVGASQNGEGEFVRIKLKVQPWEPKRRWCVTSDIAPFIREHVDSASIDRVTTTRRKQKNRNLKLVRIAYDAERWLAWRFGGIGPKHLQAYLDQFCYMWNRRKQPLSFSLLTQCSNWPAITYPVLTRRSTDSTRLARSRLAQSVGRFAS